LQPDTAHRLRTEPGGPVTHLRLDVYPDGGVARFRAYGEATDRGLAALTEAWERALR
jgi:allantoicase